MQTLEEFAISRIMHEGSPQKALNMGVCDKWFKDTACRLAWQAIVDFASKPATRNKCPTISRIEKLVPSYRVCECPEESLEEILGDLAEVRARGILQAGIVDLDEILRGAGVDMAVAHLNELVRDLGENLLRPAHMSLDLVDAIPAFIENYEKLAQGGGVIGLPFPFEPMNRTGGLQPGTLNIIYAPSKNGKTWIGLEIGAVYPFEVANARCLVISNEMPIHQIWRRILARICRLDYGDVTGGSIPLDARDTSFDMLTQLQIDQMETMRKSMGKGGYRDIRVCKPAISEGGGVNAIRNEIERFEPDIVLVDGLYLMGDDRQGGKRDNDWRAIANITQDLKALAGEKNIPIVGTTQSNREGVKRKMKNNAELDSYDDIAFGLSAVQDADLVMRLQKIRDYNNGNDRILITLPAIRDASIDPFTITFKPVISFDLDMVGITPEQLASLNVEEDTPQEPPVRRQQQNRRNTNPEPEFQLGDYDPFSGG